MLSIVWVNEIPNTIEIYQITMSPKIFYIKILTIITFVLIYREE